MSRTGAAPLLRSTALLIRLRLRRLANQLTAGSQRRKKAGDKTRTGNAGKKSSKIILYLAGPMMLFGFGTIAASAMFNLHLALDPPDTFWVTVEFSTALTVGVAFLLLCLWTVVPAADDRVGRTRQTRLGSRVADHAADPLGHLAVGANPRTQRRQSFGRDCADARVHAHRLVFRLPLDCTHRRSAGRLAVAAARGAGAHAARHRPAAHDAARRNCATCTPSSRCCPSSPCISRFPSGLAGKSDFMLGVAATDARLAARTRPMGLTVRAINERGLADAALLSLTLARRSGRHRLARACAAAASAAPRRDRRQRARVPHATRAIQPRGSAASAGASRRAKAAQRRTTARADAAAAATAISSCRAW